MLSNCVQAASGKGWVSCDAIVLSAANEWTVEWGYAGEVSHVGQKSSGSDWKVCVPVDPRLSGDSTSAGMGTSREEVGDVSDPGSVEELDMIEDDDGYDPRSPEFIQPATEGEVEERSRKLLEQQIAKLEAASAKRRQELAPPVARHYQSVLSDLRRKVHFGGMGRIRSLSGTLLADGPCASDRGRLAAGCDDSSPEAGQRKYLRAVQSAPAFNLLLGEEEDELEEELPLPTPQQSQSSLSDAPEEDPCVEGNDSHATVNPLPKSYIPSGRPAKFQMPGDRLGMDILFASHPSIEVGDQSHDFQVWQPL